MTHQTRAIVFKLDGTLADSVPLIDGMPGLGITTGVASRDELLAAGARAVVDRAEEIVPLLAQGRPGD